jgi:hypothetical protein
VGVSTNDLVDKIYLQLTESEAARLTKVPVDDSTVMNAYDAYVPLQTKTLILAEIFELIRAGVLMQVRLTPKSEGVNFDFEFNFNTGYLILTIYGVQFLVEELLPPYFSEAYLERLKKVSDPDEELQGYLSEGLACLRSHLGRASAILLRIAAEHMLNVLVESTQMSIKQDKEQQKFKGKIRSAGIKIEERAEVVFKKLESSTVLIPDKPYFRNMISHRLRPAFHSIRDLGGKAAHLASAIQLEEVADHYTVYASTVYPIIVKIIEYQKTL